MGSREKGADTCVSEEVCPRAGLLNPLGAALQGVGREAVTAYCACAWHWKKEVSFSRAERGLLSFSEVAGETRHFSA